MRKRLREKLFENEDVDVTKVSSSFDIVGDIAITKLPEGSSPEVARKVAEAILKTNTNIKTVMAQTSNVEGDYRLRKLIRIGGEPKTRTVHKEHGCAFAVDVETCYFSPRLAGERLRISKLVRQNEVVLNMFAGVGCFSILIAKAVPTGRIYSIDLNPEAFAYMQENVRLNRVFSRVIPQLGDAKDIIKTQLCGVTDRVLMPLPEKALEYLPSAVVALKPSGGWIHVHLFQRAPGAGAAGEKAKATIARRLTRLGVVFEFGVVREVRSVGPCLFQIVADVHVLPVAHILA